MTRLLVYGGSLIGFLAVFAMTLTSIIVPRWTSWTSETPDGETFDYTYGLHKRCSSLTNTCEYFPRQADCLDDRSFCSMWRSVGFLMSVAIVLEGMTIVAYLVIVAGGKQRRESGWKILAALHLVCAAMLCAAMSIMAYIFDNDDRFFPGWRLDYAWVLCTLAWSVSLLVAFGIVASALLLPTEGGYELIPSQEVFED